jgi:hypothetical protein
MERERAAMIAVESVAAYTRQAFLDEVYVRDLCFSASGITAGAG